MFNALFGSAAPLHCAKFLKRFDDNRMKVSPAKQRRTWLEGGANNIMRKVNVSTKRCISSECIPLIDQQRDRDAATTIPSSEKVFPPDGESS